MTFSSVKRLPYTDLPMSRMRYITIFFALLSYVMASAQPFDRALRRNLWNDGPNVNGIRQDSLTVSYAETGGTYRAGDFRDTWQAQSQWSAGAVAKTVTHLERFSMKGAFSFEQTEGYGMCGSMFIKPGFYPVDVLEFTPGRKTLQTYAFDGGISVELADGWRIGGDIAFESSNYSKRKDLRHTNYRLDMTVTPSVMYHGHNWAAGLSYIFNRNTESVKAEQIGVSESSYYAFLDKGMMFGTYEMWEGNGVHLAESGSGVNGFPVAEMSHALSLQGSIADLYADVSVGYRYGSIGEKQSIWFGYSGTVFSAQLAYRLVREKGSLFFRLAFDGERMVNRENVLEKVTANGVTTIHKRASNKIFHLSAYTLRPQVEYIGGIWDVRGGVDLAINNRISALFYPLYHTGKMMVADVWADVLASLGQCDIGMKISLADGSYDEGRRSVADIHPEKEPYRLETWHLAGNEYMTAIRSDLGLSFRWNFMKGLYAEVSGAWTHGFGLRHIAGADRWGAEFKFGYNF